MAAEDVQRVLIGVVILVVGISIINVIVSSPECDEMAIQTEQQLAAAINEATYLPAVSSEPSYSDSGKFLAVPIRFCQSTNSLDWLGVAVSGKTPQYQVFYENAE